MWFTANFKNWTINMWKLVCLILEYSVSVICLFDFHTKYIKNEPHLECINFTVLAAAQVMFSLSFDVFVPIIWYVNIRLFERYKLFLFLEYIFFLLLLLFIYKKRLYTFLIDVLISNIIVSLLIITFIIRKYKTIYQSFPL